MPKKKILLVDDSSTVLLLHRMMLSHCGYELLTARDGQEALDKASTERPDLIFLDVLMPRMDGFQTCRALRSRTETRDVPIILVTTRGEPHYVRQGFESGCTDYITKPFDGEELLAKVRSHLEEARRA
ncbi:PleD family two-component system response regulator [Vitiosangium sp. GDMCC 1.1324]|uniref:response regulator n=1 Tax=Vitiosangium sp. (strain GDMCC 1.1324) TaxID=2138576 RepID=UPI000D3D49FC|nr:response regulator [Vitiosangium sp. GDMCC 1.1324]PTL83209.1 response regulator [Vitiosangium sp. GDMCC 1.1324]